MAGTSDRVTRVLERLMLEDMRGQMERLFGQPYEKAASLHSERFADVGFETLKDGTRVNRLGWTLSNVKWLLHNHELVEDVVEDGLAISARYRYVVFCGMGGSGLSVQVVKTTFGGGKTRLYSLRTTDPAALAEILEDIAHDAGTLEKGLNKALIIPVSKSGTTQETVSHKAYFEALYAKCRIDVKDHMWVITDKGSPMDTGDYVQREIQLNGRGDIGGRFTSPTTRVFLLPLALSAPEAVSDVLRQAEEMNGVKGIYEDTYVRLGAFLYHMAADLGKDKVTFIVPEEFKDLPMWAEQMFEESLGKGGKGVTVFYGERLHPDALKAAEENDRVFIRVNLGGKKTEGAFWRHLTMEGYPTYELHCRDRNSIGGLMLGLQRAVATIGYLWGICFVDQPAVEGYKKATREIMAQGAKVRIPESWDAESAGTAGLRLYYGPLIRAGGIRLEELRSELDRHGADVDDAAAVYASILRLLSMRDAGFEACELASYGRMSHGLRRTLEGMRYVVFTKGLMMPSKLGEGPDKNHSYQQNMEDGRDMFFSTYFMPLIVKEPGKLRFGDSLLKAQTIGTVDSMVKRGRKAVLIAFERDSDVAGFYKDVRTHLEWMS